MSIADLWAIVLDYIYWNKSSLLDIELKCWLVFWIDFFDWLFYILIDQSNAR